MTSLAFPKMFVADNTTTVSNKDAASQNLKLLLKTKIGEYFGDPEYGSTLISKFYQFNSVILVDILKDELYTLICNYIPQLYITRDDIVITRDKNSMNIQIYGVNLDTQDNQSYTFNIAT